MLNDLLAHYDVLPLGYVILGALSIYLVVGFMYLRVTPGERSSALRLPALLLTVGFAGNFIEPLARLPFDTVLITLAAVWIGYTIISHQLFNPLAVMNDQLTDANKSLRNIIFELAAEKERVETLNAELIKTSQYKSEFLAKMSHELRTPLNSIVGYSELLLQGIYGDLAEKQVDRMEKIHRNGRDLLALINDILDLSKIEAGRLELDLHSMNLHDQLVEVAATFGPQIEQKGLEYTVDLPEKVYPIFADPLRMRQILANLMSNALKFTAEGSIRLKATHVTVKNGQSEQIALPVQGWISDGRWSVIQVADTGIGIAPQDQASIFDEFRQVDSTSTREYGGSGLGLAITRKLVEMHGGRIWLRSTLDQGSTFFVALPASSLSVAESAPPPTPPTPEAEAPLVLVIDDSQEAIDILSTYLQAGGYRVASALNGLEGLAQAADLQPDVITVDIMMPDLSGWQVIDRLKADPMTTDIPVVVVSIVDEAPTNVRLDVAAHISKPVSQQDLLRTLRQAIRPGADGSPVLVVDDNPQDRELITAMLASAGYDTRTCAGGQEALDWLRLQRASLVILDLLMPDVSGFDVLAAIRDDPGLKNLPVLVVSAKDLTADEERFIKKRIANLVKKQGLSSADLLTQIHYLAELTSQTHFRPAQHSRGKQGPRGATPSGIQMGHRPGTRSNAHGSFVTDRHRHAGTRHQRHRLRGAGAARAMAGPAAGAATSASH